MARKALNLVLLWAAASGCYAHDVASRGSESGQAQSRAARPLVASMRGRYAITRGQERIGEERFTITSSAGFWRAEGTIAFEGPVPQTQRYMLEIDARTREPVAFQVSIELAGETQTSTGRRTEDDYFEIESKTIAGPRTRKIPYGVGTAIDLGSPITSTLVLSLLGDTFELAKPINVRTIVISIPTLDPVVVLLSYELHAREATQSKIAFGPIGARRPTALWVRPDGLPTRVRFWSDAGGDPFELRLLDE